MATTEGEAGVRTAFRHYSQNRNIGDRHSGPYAYFDYPAPELQSKASGWTRRPTVIYGGGLLWGMLQAHHEAGLLSADTLVAWGVGIRGDLGRAPVRAVLDAFDLVGLREHDPGSRHDHVPCVSCMHPFFDALPPPIHDVVLYRHTHKSEGLVSVPGIPESHNHAGGGLDRALAFLASGATVVTSSYHGAYWALLMGRRVLCLPFNDKFDRFRRPPGFSTFADWPRELHRARAADGWLEECRAANRAFDAKVRDRISATGR